MAIVSYLSLFDTSTKGGPFGVLIGPTNTLHFGWDVLAMAIVSLIVYYLALRLRLPDDAVQVYIDEVDRPRARPPGGARAARGGAPPAGRARRGGRGAPAEEIIAAAEQRGADLIVVGQRGRSAIARFIAGSVTDRVVRHASCDVLVVR